MGKSSSVHRDPQLVRRDDLLDSHFLKDSWLSPERRPVKRFSTLMSSSRSSQCIPCPRPINFQLSRSCSVACNRRGNQVSGTDMVRPSFSSTLTVSSVIDMNMQWFIRIAGIKEETIRSVSQYSWHSPQLHHRLRITSFILNFFP